MNSYPAEEPPKQCPINSTIAINIFYTQIHLKPPGRKHPKPCIVQLLDLGTNPLLQALLGSLKTAHKTLLCGKLTACIVQIFGGLVQFAHCISEPFVEILVRDAESCNLSLSLGEFLGLLLDFGLLGDDFLLDCCELLLELLDEGFALAVLLGIYTLPALNFCLEILTLGIQLHVAMLAAVKITLELHVDGFLLSHGHAETVDFSHGNVELHLERLVCSGELRNSASKAGILIFQRAQLLLSFTRSLRLSGRFFLQASLLNLMLGSFL
ncbi:uncharacterized protein N7496_003224 [Penicillium cataractarum]|uniref:Uncharacterized protein n=1 Tax=Penicillium cataractarum TaxID=2100454 RepID=A0A9W9SLL2_9EURO|nr:uncharacterized protein N7496_003224 [Penicillium cataractarum]KAJ5380796.1 hypothetical protein N7496_003224 [Penicillium cataractarum]